MGLFLPLDGHVQIRTRHPKRSLSVSNNALKRWIQTTARCLFVAQSVRTQTPGCRPDQPLSSSSGLHALVGPCIRGQRHALVGPRIRGQRRARQSPASARRRLGCGARSGVTGRRAGRRTPPSHSPHASARRSRRRPPQGPRRSLPGVKARIPVLPSGGTLATPAPPRAATGPSPGRRGGLGVWGGVCARGQKAERTCSNRPSCTR